MTERGDMTAWRPWSDAGGWLRGLGLAAVAAVFLSISNAFGTGEMPFALRLAYWSMLLVLGTLWGSLVARYLLRPEDRRGRWVRVVLTAVVMAVPFTGVVWVFTRTFVGAGTPARLMPLLFLPVFAISLAMVALNVLVEGRRADAAQAPPPAPPKFLERLPLRLRGAEVWAVEAEDHYLRLHTSKGQDLILMRLADAVSELEGIEGMQVHRSWWVARDAITDARRGDGRATLTLKDGSQVPVSRTYAAQLRERGWI